LVFAIAGWGLSELYSRSALRGLDRELDVVIDGVLARIDVQGEAVAVANPPNDTRFAAAFSGRYWQVTVLSPNLPRAAHSDSLWDETLPLPADIAKALQSPLGKTRYYDGGGPRGQHLRIAALAVKADDMAAPVAVLAAADRRFMESDVQKFTLTLLAALAALGAGLVAAVFLQVRVGLAPLEEIQRDVSEVRRGRKARLDGDYPTEVAPLTAELNALLDHNREVVERARTHVGNLAHALKTPISVLLNEARADKTPLGDLVGRQSEVMARNVEHYLQRAQAAARAEAIGARTEVRAVLDDISRTLERLYGREKDIEITLDAPADAVFRGERQDLEEMAGNLMENACKYGKARVAVYLAPPPRGGGRLQIHIDDDGPGLSPEEQEVAVKRGARLDQTAPGQGLGLSITDDLARAYGGQLTFARGPLGGLRATLTLPATD
jgi:signal transduction histidine kinase